MQCNCGSALAIKQEKLLKFYQCPKCKRVLRKDKVLNDQETLDKIKAKEQ